MLENDFEIFSGNSNPLLAMKICNYLGKPLGSAKVVTFSDGEIRIEINENVRNKDIFIVQSTCAPVNNNLMELIFMIDAFKRSSARKITAVIPYFGYARQDKKVMPRVPISAKVVADMISNVGAQRIITMELHAGQIQGFFNIPVDNLFALPIVMDYVKANFDKDVVIVSPDAGGVERARALAKSLGVDIAIIDKRRDRPNDVAAMKLIGDVADKIAIIVDDIADTSKTVTQAAITIMDKNAKAVLAACIHPVLSGGAVDLIIESTLREFIVTDTIPLGGNFPVEKKFTVLSVANLIGEAIIRSVKGDSVSDLFEYRK